MSKTKKNKETISVGIETSAQNIDELANATLRRAPMIIRTRSGPRLPAEKTYWRRPGGVSKSEFVQNQVFDHDDYRRHYKAGDDCYGYGCGCVGLFEAARRLHLPLFKFAGLSQLPQLLTRQDQINKDRYASYRRVSGVFEEDQGFDSYEMETSELLFDLHANSPVTVVPRGLRFQLPATLSFAAFDRAMRTAMSPSSLNAFAKSSAGRAHFALLGIDPATVPRFTGYRFGDEVRYSPAEEIQICRPRRDFTRMAILAETIIINHVMAQPDADCAISELH